MYVVLDKKTKKIVHKNPAPLVADLKPQEVYFKFDPATMEIGKTDGVLPEHFDVDKNGNIVERSLEKLASEGIIKLKPNEKFDGDKIVPKTLTEQWEEGLIQIPPTQKIGKVNGVEQIVEKTLLEQVEEKIIELAQNQKVVNNEIVILNDRQMFDEKRLDLEEYKRLKIEYFSRLAFEKRAEILPEYKIQNAALGVYNKQKTEEIKNTILSFKQEFKTIKGEVESAKTADDVDKVKDSYPGELLKTGKQVDSSEKEKPKKVPLSSDEENPEKQSEPAEKKKTKKSSQKSVSAKSKKS